ncbi:uncharacterized protein LOC134252913 [Saccostrea cucullata]|uniref:uncharacterized protein LOC134252913 n=1 Tax=Saccostrea cuccullata TaxID=36930 RepID=UPI002ED67344
MRTTGLKKSKITGFSGVHEVLRIQYDEKYNSYLSTDNDDFLFLTTNTHGDIYVADWAGEAVVVFNALGDFRFRYTGNVSETKLKKFKPYDIATDINQNMLVTDTENNLIHVIDQDGNVIRHIEHLHVSVGPFCIDSQENLFIGDISTGLVQLIKYRV